MTAQLYPANHLQGIGTEDSSTNMLSSCGVNFLVT